MSYIAKYEDLMSQTFYVDSQSEILLLEQAARLADSHNDIDLGFRARRRMLSITEITAYVDKMLAAYAWCLTQCDQLPDIYNDRDLLWSFKWLVYSLPECSYINKKQIHSIINDMEQRWQKYQLSMHTIHYMRYIVAVTMADRETAKKYYALCQQTSRGEYSDCSSCEHYNSVRYRVFMEEYGQAFAEAKKILDQEHSWWGCSEAPALTPGELIIPALKLGKIKEAQKYHQLGYENVYGNRRFFETLAQHFMYLIYQKDDAECRKLFDKHIPIAFGIHNDFYCFQFYLAATCFFSNTNKDRINVSMPKNFILHNPEQIYGVSDLKYWFMKKTRDLAVAFDERNGNDYYQREMNVLMELLID
ncbi:hypothetical protein [Candidatus Uabimicrobium amorphum]|uniref:Uncharacterized protein n=1 Tax=Uabimicrobium amorphum TaxID=2596890 RepID=A0A5S9IRP6_UABAM|nr:hypothetical protein [Candidatus Uabimicrobium amorphum]BBM86320.1 hypothetical protein UABAM_04706 [Candidatus Uabimicrobium amorphum]